MVISYEVANADEALAKLNTKGYKTIDNKPRLFAGTRYAFINHPKELCGVLTEVLDRNG